MTDIRAAAERLISLWDDDQEPITLSGNLDDVEAIARWALKAWDVIAIARRDCDDWQRDLREALARLDGEKP